MKQVAAVFLSCVTLFSGIGTGGIAQAQSGQKKPLSETKIEGLELSESSLQAALDFLQVKAAAAGAHPVNFILYDPNGTIDARNPSVSLKLTDIPLSFALKYVCELTDTTWIKDSDAILIGEKEELAALKEIRRHGPANVGQNPQILQLAKIRVTELDFSQIDLATAIDYFSTKANENPNQRIPVNFWIKEDTEKELGTRLVTLKVKDVSLLQAFRYTTELAGCTMRLDRTAIVVGEHKALSDTPRFLPRPGNPLEKQLTAAIINDVELIDAPLADVITFIRHHTNDLNIISQSRKSEGKTVSMKFKKTRAVDLLKYANEATGTTFRAEQNAIIIRDQPPKPAPKPEEKTAPKPVDPFGA